MSKKYDAGVKEYRATYWTPDYVPLATDLLACFKCTGQEGVPREEVAAAVAAEPSPRTWSTVWSELLTDLEFYKGRWIFYSLGSLSHGADLDKKLFKSIAVLYLDNLSDNREDANISSALTMGINTAISRLGFEG